MPAPPRRSLLITPTLAHNRRETRTACTRPRGGLQVESGGSPVRSRHAPLLKSTRCPDRPPLARGVRRGFRGRPRVDCLGVTPSHKSGRSTVEVDCTQRTPPLTQKKGKAHA